MPKLTKFKKKMNKKYILIAVGALVLVFTIVLISKSYAIYKLEKNYDVIKTKIGEWRYAQNTSYDNTKTKLDCTGEEATVQCAIDKMAERLQN